VAVVCPHAASAAQWSLSGDFDGDGRRDWAAVDRDDPRLLHVYLSNTRQTTIIRSRTPIRALAAANLDGDQRQELVVRVGRSGLRVWKRGDSHFRRIRAFRPFAAGLTLPGKRLNAGLVEELPALASGSAPPQAAWYAGAASHAPDAGQRLLVSAPRVPLRVVLPHAPFAPRPPPVFA
jgi:hypothetical protein